MAKINLKKSTGVVVPLGALYSKDNPCSGEFPDLILFSKFCKQSGISIIQLLPVNDTGTQSSPYSGLSAFALHPIYICIKEIEGFSKLYSEDKNFKNDYDTFILENSYKPRYDYDSILNNKILILRKLFETTEEAKNCTPSTSLFKWIEKNQWVKAYAVYKNLKWKYMQASWKTWKKEDKEITEQEILKRWENKELIKEHLFYAWIQKNAFDQFLNAVTKVHEMGILLKGDMPILMNEDSCDAWLYPKYFNQELRAGSPSDGENPCGQNWGFPTYNWKNLEKENFDWWKQRLNVASNFYDAYRLDHILGFFRIWAIAENDINALNGHTEPFTSFNKTDLYELGFDDNRIRWLSKPHIPTQKILETGIDYNSAHKILNIFCNRIDNEELWLFKDSIKGSSQIYQTSINSELENFPKETENKIKEILIQYWSNKTLNEIQKNKYLPMWTYTQSTSWNTLNEEEKKSLTDLFISSQIKNEKLWKKMADKIFTAITSENNMIPCGEDLGVSIKCVPGTMKEHNILGLRVIRWCREWDKEKQPFIEFEKYESLSVATTSVHDSSTLRAWFDEEYSEKNENEEFSPDKAFELLKEYSLAKSIWYIPPLQDLLYLNKKYWLEKSSDERINIPGTVSKFNWTYRMPVSLEELCNDTQISRKIMEIAKRK